MSLASPRPAIRTRTRRRVQWGVHAGMLPALFIAVVGYFASMVWTVGISFTESRMLPVARFAGWNQYARLFGTERWIISLENMAIFGVLMIAASLTLGTLLAFAIDKHVRGEDAVRVVCLYPYALSFVVTGFVWQWVLNPELGVQHAVRDLGWTGFRFDWIVQQPTAIYCIVLAGVWHASGLVMAIVLAGLRGIDPELRHAARVDGIRPWRINVHILLPLLRPHLITSAVLLSFGVVKLYDLVVVLTGGGPGISSEVPAKFVMDSLFIRQNIGLATAGATVLLAGAVSLLAPWLHYEYVRRPRARTA